MDNIEADLRWKAEYLQHRGYYKNLTMLQLIEMLRKSGEIPYPWKRDINTPLVDSTEKNDPKG
jgi:hypothetical protein